MMRRFSRKRRGEGAKKASDKVDVAQWFEQVQESGVIPVSGLEVLVHGDIPERLASVGRGTGESGASAVVAFSPSDAGDALLAALATGMRLAEEESFTGQVFVVAPTWSISARRRLGLVKAELPFELRAVAAPGLGRGPAGVEAEAELEPSALRLDGVGAQLADASERALFERAAQSLEGLAAKHGGSVRALGRSIELVLLAQRIAELRAEDGAIALHVLGAQRRRTALDPKGLAAAFDDLEGQIRRHLNDKKTRGSEERLRIEVNEGVVGVAGLRDAWAWPLGGADRDVVDLVALRADGRPVACAGRRVLDLAALGRFLDGVQKLRLAMPALFAEAKPPVRLETPELILAASEFSAGALRALSGLALAHTLYEIRSQRGQAPELVAVGAEEAVRSKRDGPAGRRRQGGRSGRSSAEAPASEREARSGASADEEGAGGRGSSRRRGRRRGRGREQSEEADAKPSESGTRSNFEEVSLFDLDEGQDESPGGRRRGRSRQRGRRRGEPKREGKGETDSSADAELRSPPGPGTETPGEPEESEEFADDLTEVLSEIPEDLPALQASGGENYAADDVDDGGDSEEADDRQRERDKRRSARKADIADVPVAVESPRPPRRRAVIVSAADRDSLTTAVLLARDVRLLEGVWVYEQAELMNFFREVMPDVQEDVPIHLVGFIPSPVTEILQAAALYRDRLSWYDHHAWPPEDVFALRQAIGEDAVHHAAGAGSSLPVALSTCTRRSRFSDKLVDLACGRFTEHDYERWGRLWWWRLGELAKKSGDIRSEIEPLLAGRPSDLAKESAKADVPEPPGEVAYVAGRDFKLVHFAGYSMVVVNAGEGVDIQLAARIARERYGAELSLAFHEGSNLFVLSGEESGGRRTLDFAALAEHLADKLEWVGALPDDDHVARFLVGGLELHPERLDEITGEIAMGRSILER